MFAQSVDVYVRHPAGVGHDMHGQHKTEKQETLPVLGNISRSWTVKKKSVRVLRIFNLFSAASLFSAFLKHPDWFLPFAALVFFPHIGPMIDDLRSAVCFNDSLRVQLLSVCSHRIQ